MPQIAEDPSLGEKQENDRVISAYPYSGMTTSWKREPCALVFREQTERVKRPRGLTRSNPIQ